MAYDALTRAGLATPSHSTQIGSAIASDNQNDKTALFPAGAKTWLLDFGVFDSHRVATSTHYYGT